MNCFISGHRDLPPELVHDIIRFTGEQILRVTERGVRNYYAGGAVGFDMIASLLILKVKRDYYRHIKLHIILPCPSYGHRQWSTESERDHYMNIINNADSVQTTASNFYNGVFLARNRQLVDCGSDIGIVYAEPGHTTGGTYSTIKYAQSIGTEIINICEVIRGGF